MSRVDGVKAPIAAGRSGGKAKEPALAGESFVAAATANRTMLADTSCPPDPLRAPRAVLLFTGHLKGTCDSRPVWSADQRVWLKRRSPKIDAIVNQTRWCREAFGGGCHAFLHTWPIGREKSLPCTNRDGASVPACVPPACAGESLQSSTAGLQRYAAGVADGRCGMHGLWQASLSPSLPGGARWTKHPACSATRPAPASQHGQSVALAAPQLTPCASSARAWRLWAAQHSQSEAQPLGAPATASAARASRLQSRRFSCA